MNDIETLTSMIEGLKKAINKRKKGILLTSYDDLISIFGNPVENINLEKGLVLFQNEYASIEAYNPPKNATKVMWNIFSSKEKSYVLNKISSAFKGKGKVIYEEVGSK